MEQITAIPQETETPTRSEIIFDDVRLVAVLGVKRGRQIVQRIALPDNQAGGLPILVDEESFAKAYRWLNEQADAYQAQIDNATLSAISANGVAPMTNSNGDSELSANTVRLPLPNAPPTGTL